MSKLSMSIALASAMLVPAYASAEVSVAESLNDEAAFSIDVPSSVLDDNGITRGTPGGCGPSGCGPRGGYRPPHHPGHAAPPPPPRPRVRHYRTTIVRPQPVVVVEQPSTVVVSEHEESVSSSHVGSIFGFGVRGVGLYQSPIRLEGGDCLKTQVNGGVGYYIKFRPVRFISIEFINDILFGGYKDNDGSYVRVPVALGLRGHFFDYGAFDVYLAAAASVSFISLSDGYDSHWYDSNYDSTHFASFGGQFGAGVSFIASGFEFGLDARYTIEQAPESSMFGYVDKTDNIHGVMFSLNLGFAL